MILSLLLGVDSALIQSCANADAVQLEKKNQWIYTAVRKAEGYFFIMNNAAFDFTVP